MENNKYSVSEFAKLIGVTAQTLRNWDAKGVMRPALVLPTGKRIYTEEQLVKYRKEQGINVANRVCVYYFNPDSNDNIDSKLSGIRELLNSMDSEYSIYRDTSKSLVDSEMFVGVLEKLSKYEFNTVYLISENNKIINKYHIEVLEALSKVLNFKLEIL